MNTIDQLRRLNRIMLVDDNPYDNEFHSIVLRRAGFDGEIEVCETGEDALAYFASTESPEVDLLFLDVNLSGWSGFDIARQLAERAATSPGMVVVMLTSSSDPRDELTATSIPLVRGFVTKPLNAQQIETLIGRYWDSSGE